ncbi:MAG: HDIG domain-containing protein [Deltaproteobacteria bacterium]|jgi:putative nucleotidyltransferase with HDIG domain|nr:HDIG domain-containing protein [Deltaproteobacteria bacterium]
MPKSDRKIENGAVQKHAFRQNPQVLSQDDERFQRIFLLLVLVTLLTFIIVPKGVLTTTEFVAGDIAPLDIKAPRDLLVPDEELTRQKRDEAERSVANLYDFDTTTGEVVSDQVAQVFNALHAAAEHELPVDQQIAELESSFGFKIDQKGFAALQELSSKTDNNIRISQLLKQLYRQKIAGNLKLFEADRPKGVVFRQLDSQTETTDDGNEVVIGLGQLHDLLKKALADSGFTANQEKVLKELVLPMLRPNITFNQNETEARRKAAGEAVKPVLIQVKKGEMIVREGDRISIEQVKRLSALQDGSSTVSLWRNATGLLLSCFLLIYFTHTFARRNIRKYQVGNRDLVFLSAVFVVHILILKISIFISSALGSAFPYVEQNAYFYFFPFAVGTMLVRIVINSEVSLVFAILTAIITGALFGNSFAIMFFAFLTSLAGAHWVRHVNERSTLFRAGFRLGMFNFTLLIALHLMTSKPFDLQLIYKLVFGFSGGLAAAVMVTGIVPLIESIFRYTTNIKLLELANMNNPLLRDLMVQAPGTYHHSIIVGNLAEAAAENIGVNPLMVRVAAYYHDIGKIRKPLYFIENIGAQENRHDKLAPSMSALVLMAHVKDGTEMAHEARLGKALNDIIREHHGTSLMKFFYDRAKSKADPGVEQVDERDYRYPGPKPQTREAALIMLADAVEAASRTLTDPTPARVQGMVQKIINNIFIDGQLDECELTLKDIHNIAKSFNLVLGGIFHYRVDYPEPVSKERGSEKGPRGTDEDRDRKPSEKAENRKASATKGSTEDLKRLGMS